LRGSASRSPSGSLALVFALLLVLPVACGEPVATPEPVLLRGAASSTMSPLLQALADAYRLQQPLFGMELADLGTQYALEALRTGKVDFAMASWLPSAPDSGLHATAIARDGIAIIVHPSNPIESMGLLQLQDLFSGRTYEWKDIGGRTTQGPVQPVSRESGSGTKSAFDTLVMVDEEVTPRAIVAPSSRAVVQFVAEQHNAIGYVSMGSVSSDVKILKIEGDLPTQQAVGEASYPLTRELWLVTTTHHSEALKEFLRFVLSPAGQQIVGQRHGRMR
jgi:phosphate transport system substrate-binding protein